MNRFSTFTLITVLVLLFATGCNHTNPVNPSPEEIYSSRSADLATWGLWECTFNPDIGEFDIVPLRTAMFTMNLNSIMASKPGSFSISDIDASGLFLSGRLDCTVNVTHPFPGFDQFHGFDVRGVFLHNGTSKLDYNGLTYGGGPGDAGDEAQVLNPDGFTRWFNANEFNGGDFPLFEFTSGTPSNLPNPTASLNAFKIFTETLDETTDYYSWIKIPGYANFRNIFRAGTTNSRRYEIAFPMPGGFPEANFNFAITASWEKGDPTVSGNPDEYEVGDFPPGANIDEPFYIHVSTSSSDLYHDISGVDPKFGGDFLADIEIFDWQGGFVDDQGVINEIHTVNIEGNFLPSGPIIINQPDLEPIASDGGVVSSIFNIEITACTPQSSGDAEFWVIVESDGENGDSYDQGFPSVYPDPARRAAFYRGSVLVSDEAPFVNTPPVINRIEDDIVGGGAYLDPVSTNHHDVTYTLIFNDPDIDQTHTFTWWIVEDTVLPTVDDIVTMPIDWGTYPIGDYDIYVEVDDGFGPVAGGPYNIEPRGRFPSGPRTRSSSRVAPKCRARVSIYLMIFLSFTTCGTRVSGSPIRTPPGPSSTPRISGRLKRKKLSRPGSA